MDLQNKAVMLRSRLVSVPRPRRGVRRRPRPSAHDPLSCVEAAHALKQDRCARSGSFYFSQPPLPPREISRPWTAYPFGFPARDVFFFTANAPNPRPVLYQRALLNAKRQRFNHGSRYRGGKSTLRAAREPRLEESRHEARFKSTHAPPF